ncbi:DUF222 domain-containing protein [Pedococcus sp. 2YAF34]|uniref:HNH endonuclease signature motif containing protein n=1 Tax=Pedococcus sp. 2YAF34 TaxID=3233032 RepID=UPI003F94C075
MAISPGAVTLTASGLGRPVVGSATLARGVLHQGTPERLWALRDEEVAQALTVLGDVAATVRAQMVLVLAEAKRRSLGSGDGWGPVDWARAMAPLLPMRDLLEADEVAGAVASDERRLDDVVEAVVAATSSCPDERSEALPVGKAAQIVRFHTSIRGLTDAESLADGTALLVDAARGASGLSDQALARAIRHAGEVARPDRLVERDAELRRAHRSLVKGRGPVGMARYVLVLDEEGAAIVDAAVDALAKPRPDEDTGEHDPRTPAARRADALLDLVSRAVGAPAGVPRQAKVSLVVTVGLDVLQEHCRGAGVTMAGEVLTAGTLRRLACDAQVVPVVLGTDGEVLDQGVARRLFDRAQIRHLWLRDQHCTFPRCSKPATWTDAHHLVHWADGGPTDVDNAALLCRAHHSVVHRHRYGGRVRRAGGRARVEWDLTPDSYDTAVAEWRTERRPLPPRP